MNFYARFPELYIRNDFYANVGILIFDLAFLAFLIWDLVVSRRSPGFLTRVGTICFLLGMTVFRAYSVWALWRFNPPSLSTQRIDTDIFVISINMVAISCWVADRFIEKRKMERSMQIRDNERGAMGAAKPDQSA